MEKLFPPAAIECHPAFVEKFFYFLPKNEIAHFLTRFFFFQKRKSILFYFHSDLWETSSATVAAIFPLFTLSLLTSPDWLPLGPRG